MTDVSAWLQIVAIGAPIASGLLTLIVTDRLARRKHIADLITTKKLETLSEICSQLRGTLRLFETNQPYYDENAENAFQDERVNRREAKAWGRYASARSLLDRNRFILSNRFVQRFDVLHAELDRFEDEIPPERQRRVVVCLLEGIDDLEKIAKRDIPA